jgi:hypothetical protein
LRTPGERHNRYPFEKTYARRSAIIIALAVLTFLLLTYPNLNLALYEDTALLTAVFSFLTFGIRFLPFRRILPLLRTQDRVMIGKNSTQVGRFAKALVITGLLLLILFSIFSIRLVDPMVWLSALFGYILGLNIGELTYYFFIRSMENSIGLLIYTFDSEDLITKKRIRGYCLEKGPN